MTWKPVTKVSQVKKGTKLKIIGKNPRDSYKWITAKEILRMENSQRKWIEVLVNKKKNYYFNLTAWVYDQPMWGGWIKELYFKEPKKGEENES